MKTIRRNRIIIRFIGELFWGIHLLSNKAKLTFRTRNEALNAYRMYFDSMYGTDKAFTEYFDKIYEKYKNGETIYLQCFCKPEPCHGDIILEKLQQKYAKELIKNKLKMSK